MRAQKIIRSQENTGLTTRLNDQRILLLTHVDTIQDELERVEGRHRPAATLLLDIHDALVGASFSTTAAAVAPHRGP